MVAFHGSHVVVTGGTGALGTAVVTALRAAGAVCHVTNVVAAELADFPQRTDPAVHVARDVDLADEAAVRRYYERLPPLWASVHLAGGFAMAPAAEISAADFEAQFRINALSCFLCSAAAVRAIRSMDQPVIAAVNGVAAGAGAVIALAADLRLLARSARFAFLFTRVGLAGADMGSAYLLPRVIGFGRATELLLLGETVEAERALEIGLATAVVDDEALAEAALTTARRLADGPALAYSTTKVLLTRELDMGLGGSLELDAMTQALLMGSHDHAEYHRAWTEGRAPVWEGR